MFLFWIFTQTSSTYWIYDFKRSNVYPFILKVKRAWLKSETHKMTKMYCFFRFTFQPTFESILHFVLVYLVFKAIQTPFFPF